jgi:glycosyltransferase involved in cell wall biosynthesis
MQQHEQGRREDSPTSERLRVLVVSNVGPVAGGHRVQALSTANALKSLGVEVSFTTDVGEDGRGYDVMHAFNAPRSTLRAARRAGAVVVVSPIWWSADYQLLGPGRGNRRPARAIFIGSSVVRRGGWQTARRVVARIEEAAMVFECADLLLPNSTLEAQQISDDLNVTTPMHIVPNAVDAELFSPPPAQGDRSGVLYVARLEPHKNQLALIRALNGSGIPLTLVGPNHSHHPGYAERCRREADENVTFLGPRDHEALVDLYRRAAVHAMPSWFETTGLSSLEAAATGAAIVTTNRGFASEYFGDLATYCDPGVRGSIRKAVEKALSAPAPEALRRRILQRYTWEHAARETYAGYLTALQRRTFLSG